MILAGLGFRRAVGSDEIVALVERALGCALLPKEALTALATAEALSGAPAFLAAADRLGVGVMPIDPSALRGAAPQVRTVSPRALAAHGVGSVAEAAALAGAGPGATLLLERIASPSATCAIARSLETPR